jgi:hypothetical protein
MKVSGQETRDLIQRAGALLRQLKDPAGASSALSADDVLLFCYRLRDGYRIVRSSSTRFGGSSFSFLQDLLYQLESRPDETLRSSEWRSIVEALLHDLVTGRITVERNVNR